jgi:predicted methyltransferase
MVNATDKEQQMTSRCSIKMLRLKIWFQTTGWKMKTLDGSKRAEMEIIS